MSLDVRVFAIVKKLEPSAEIENIWREVDPGKGAAVSRESICGALRRLENQGRLRCETLPPDTKRGIPTRKLWFSIKGPAEKVPRRLLPQQVGRLTWTVALSLTFGIALASGYFVWPGQSAYSVAVNYLGAILSKILPQALTIGAAAFLYYLAKSTVTSERMKLHLRCGHVPRKLIVRAYSNCVVAAIALGLLAAVNLGSHMEDEDGDADQLYDFGTRVQDYEPTDRDRLISFGHVFLFTLAATAIGVNAGAGELLYPLDYLIRPSADEPD